MFLKYMMCNSHSLVHNHNCIFSVVKLNSSDNPFRASFSIPNSVPNNLFSIKHVEVYFNLLIAAFYNQRRLFDQYLNIQSNLKTSTTYHYQIGIVAQIEVEGSGKIHLNARHLLVQFTFLLLSANNSRDFGTRMPCHLVNPITACDEDIFRPPR